MPENTVFDCNNKVIMLQWKYKLMFPNYGAYILWFEIVLSILPAEVDPTGSACGFTKISLHLSLEWGNVFHYHALPIHPRDSCGNINAPDGNQSHQSTYYEPIFKFCEVTLKIYTPILEGSTAISSSVLFNFSRLNFLPLNSLTFFYFSISNCSFLGTLSHFLFTDQSISVLFANLKFNYGSKILRLKNVKDVVEVSINYI